MTLQEVTNILVKQNKKCGICEIEIELGPKTHLDHDHETGKVRGFLCQKCNHGLGLFDDSVKNLKSAQKYLEKYNSELAEK